jgi:GNAT superfamily N-acetyltransferase
MQPLRNEIIEEQKSILSIVILGENSSVTKTKLVQPERSNPLWQVLLDELAVIFEGELELIFPAEWNKHYFEWFHSMEKTGFRQELHYSFEELAAALQNPELVFWFFTVDEQPQILLFGYSSLDEQKKAFYLDTFAVKRRGEGIGNIVLKLLIRWAKTKKFHSIVLDTEVKDEKGFPLQHFYAQHGFETVSISEKGDIIMKHRL